MEGWKILTVPGDRRVGGDGAAEVIAGSSGNVLHAFRADGSEPPGWPKDTGGWLLASPAVGDVDGDRKLEVVGGHPRRMAVRLGHARRPRGALEWPSFRHDLRNSGNHRDCHPYHSGPHQGRC